MSELISETQEFNDALKEAQERARKVGGSTFDAMVNTYVDFGLIREL